MSESVRDRPVVGVVLAAGKGRRMKSEMPKVLHRVAGRPMLDWVLDALDEAGCQRQLVIIGHGADEVRRQCGDRSLTWIEQLEQLGTGHALAQVESALEGEATLLVVSGDVPLVSARTSRLCGPSLREEKVGELLQGFQGPGPSRRHSKVAAGSVDEKTKEAEL